MRKYGNHEEKIDGRTFASKAEALRYQQLSLLEKEGAIKCLRLQPEYELIPKFKKGGKTYRKTVYIADFEYIEDGRKIVEDVKGFATDVYKLKKKLFEYKYPELTIKEVKKK